MPISTTGTHQERMALVVVVFVIRISRMLKERREVVCHSGSMFPADGHLHNTIINVLACKHESEELL